MTTVVGPAAAPSNILKAKLKDAGLVAVRLIVIVAAGAFAWWGGVVAGRYLSHVMPKDIGDHTLFEVVIFGYPLTTSVTRGWIATVVGVTGAGIFLKCLEIVSILPVFWEPVETAWKTGLSSTGRPKGEFSRSLYVSTIGNWKTFCLLWATAFSLVLSVSVWEFTNRAKDAKDDKADAAVQKLIAESKSNPVFHSPLPSLDPLSQKRFVVYFEENDLNAATRWDFRSGLRFAEERSTKAALTLFAKRLAYCNRDGAVAEVLVKGFASSSGPDAPNQALASERAQAVVNYLYGVATDRVDVDAPDHPSLGESVFNAHWWDTFQAMAQERGFVDKVKDEYSPKRGQLNRRAELQVVSPAACRVQ